MSDANAITNHILLEIPKRFPGARAWRRNVGSGYGMDIVQRAIRALVAGRPTEALMTLRNTRPIRFGVPGEPDIDGWAPDGRRIGIEVKAGRDVVSDDQMTFRTALLAAGGIHVIARDVEGALEDLRKQL